MTPSRLLTEALAKPRCLAGYRTDEWNAVIRVARKEMLLGTLAARAENIEVLPKAGLILDEARLVADVSQKAALYEVRQMTVALAEIGITPVLMKGSAYLSADLSPLPGRNIGDLDIMVAEADLSAAEAALKARGWHSVKAKGSYDDAYYRKHMHELPPLAHRTRGGVVDLHHTILPKTARLTPDAAAMLADAVPTPEGVLMLAQADMVLHCATHLAYDGDFSGGLRNLWDLDRLVRQFANDAFWTGLQSRAVHHDLVAPLGLSLRLARDLYGTPSPESLRASCDIVDRLALSKLRSHDRFGRTQAPISSFLLYMRGHWLRMPPLMLTRHLLTKWRAERAEARREVQTRT
ncbi:MAG: nucleotidyltransferase family protein [Pacificimonas sp.]